MEITTGRITRPLRIVAYGPEGVGKSAFAAKLPAPLFIDCEHGTDSMDVKRAPYPTSWTMFKSVVEELTKNAQGFKTLVVDTADWADRLAVAEVCALGKKKSMGDYEWGVGYTMLAEKWGQLLDSITYLQQKQQMSVVFLAHSILRRVELPDEMGAYDRYEMKLEKKTLALLREWSDMILFLNYKIIVVEQKNKKNKAQGDGRVIHTTHHASWDAKNRYDLPDEMPLAMVDLPPEMKAIPGLFAAPVNAAPTRKPEPATPLPVAKTEDKPKAESRVMTPPPPEKKEDTAKTLPALPECLPAALRDLMTMNGVSVDDLKSVCTKTYPIDTPIENYDPAFWTGKIIPAWDKVLTLIDKVRNA